MDLSNWAIVDHKDDSGFGRQAQDYKSVLGIGYHLVIPSERLFDHPLESPKEILLDPKFSDDKVRSILRGLSGIIFPERHNWHPQLLPIARELCVKTVCMPNWEWFAGKDKQWQLVDLFACQTRFTVSIVRKYGFTNVIYIPVVLDASRFPGRIISGEARLFIHNAGLVDPDDRKGTRDTIEAFKKVKRENIRLRVRMQKEVKLPKLDDRIEVVAANLPDPANLYVDGDVAIQPSKMEGSGLMVLEPLLCGMPVITTNYPPMNEYIRTAQLLVRPRWFKRRAFPSQWIKQAHLRLPDQNDLARKIEWCASHDLSPVSSFNRELAKKIFSKQSLQKQWLEALEALQSGHLNSYLAGVQE
jgi:glycosyltransferase involved in cell wall biosynthesis